MARTEVRALEQSSTGQLCQPKKAVGSGVPVRAWPYLEPPLFKQDADILGSPPSACGRPEAKREGGCSGGWKQTR